MEEDQQDSQAHRLLCESLEVVEQSLAIARNPLMTMSTIEGEALQGAVSGGQRFEGGEREDSAAVGQAGECIALTVGPAVCR